MTANARRFRDWPIDECLDDRFHLELGDVIARTESHKVSDCFALVVRDRSATHYRLPKSDAM